VLLWQYEGGLIISLVVQKEAQKYFGLEDVNGQLYVQVI
jgi:hypothetical protein